LGYLFYYFYFTRLFRFKKKLILNCGFFKKTSIDFLKVLKINFYFDGLQKLCIQIKSEKRLRGRKCKHQGQSEIFFGRVK
jgi:hypothetical protein